MDRRTLLKGLLGVGLGAGTGTGVRWEAQEAMFKHGSVTKTHAHRLRVFHLSISKLESFRAVVLTNTQQSLWAPRVKRVTRVLTEFHHPSRIEWEFNEIKILQKLTILKMHLIDELGYIVLDHTLEPPICCRPDDVLKLVNVSIDTAPS